jgi:SAM-dependent methyltransferase
MIDSVSRLSPAAVTSLRALLNDVGYDEAPMLELTGLDVLTKIPEADGPRVISELQGAGRLGVIARLFWLGMPVEVALVRDVVPQPMLQEWVSGGLLKQHQGFLHAEVYIVPWGGHLFVTDPPRYNSGSRFVMAVGGGTRVLERMMITRPVARALDLGCGCGVLSFHAAGFAEQVDGIDLNPRAVAYAKLNAMLNETTTCHFQEGDFFALDAVLGEQRYGLVVSQPPFIISPSENVLYRDVKGTGDEGLWRVANVAASRLEDGGMAQLLTSWLVPAGGDPGTRPRQNLAGLGCDALVMTSNVYDLETQAKHWIEELDLKPEERSKHIEESMRYLESLQAEAICVGMIVLRKRGAGTPWQYVTELPEVLTEGADEHLLRIFDGLDFLNREGDHGLWEARLGAPADLRVEQRLAPTEQGWVTEHCQSRIHNGMCYEVNHNAATADFVLACDGERTVEEIVQTLAKRLHQTPEQMQPLVLGVARTFVSHGLLTVGPS